MRRVRRLERRNSQKEEDAGAQKGEKVGKVAKHGLFKMIYGSGGSKRRLVSAAGTEPSGRIADVKLHAVARGTFVKSKVLKTDGLGQLLEVEMLKKCTPLWREAHLEVKSVKS